MNGLSKDIWGRTGNDTLGAHAYGAAVSLAFAWTICLVGVAAGISLSWDFSWPLLIGTFFVSIGAIFLFGLSDQWPLSLLGVSVLSVALGMMIGPVVSTYSVPIVMKALMTTAGVTLLMSILGVIYPKSMEGIGGFLLGALMLLIVGNLARYFWPLIDVSGGPPSMGILDWIGAGVFTIYIMYDWNRAMRLPKTLDNAIDSSGALILDVVNLLLDLLRLYASSDDD